MTLVPEQLAVECCILLSSCVVFYLSSIRAMYTYDFMYWISIQQGAQRRYNNGSMRSNQFHEHLKQQTPRQQ
jgi:hypothetical protein